MKQHTPQRGRRADALTAVLQSAPDSTDHDAVRDYVARLAGLGAAVLLINPGEKTPFGMVRDGEGNGGVYTATTDAEDFDAHLIRYLDRHGEDCAVNLAVATGSSRLVIVDCDSATQRKQFLADIGMDSATAPTVTSPGSRNSAGVWTHEAGNGHYWFTVPDEVDLPGNTASLTDPEGEYAIKWGRGYVLIPPSTRSEGAYEATGRVVELPTVLQDRITQYTQQREQRATTARTEIDPDDPIAVWSAGMTWAELLEPTGWINTGKSDTCGCDIWTAPGLHATDKSATAHEPGCGQPEWRESPDPPLHIWTDHDTEPFAEAVADYGSNLTRLRAYAAIHHGGQEGAAMEDLGLHAQLPTFGDKAVATVSVRDATAVPTDAADMAQRYGIDPQVVESEAQRRQLYLAGDRLARQRMTQTDAAEITLPPVTSLDTLLASEDDPVTFRIDKVWPADGAKVLCVAPAGGGKTTLSGNLVRSLADGDPFLDVFTVHQTARRIVIIDNEMTTDMLRRWLRRQGVRNTSAVVDVVTLRGQVGMFDMGNDRLRDRWSARLGDLGCDFVVFDCVKPVLEAMGLDENREMGKLLYPFSEMLAAAGVQDVLVHHHMGHGPERARGDSTVLGWSDANWKIVLDREHPAQPRYFSTDKMRGSEVIPEGLLSFDPATQHLSLTGGNRVQTKAQANAEDRLQEVLNALADAHAEGVEELTVTAVQKAVGGKKEMTDQALKLGRERNLLIMCPKGRAQLYRLAPGASDPMYLGTSIEPGKPL